MNSQLFELTGSSTKLIPMLPEHTEDLYEAASHPDIWHYLPRTIRSLADAERTIHDAVLNREKGIEYPFVVIDQLTGRIIGATRIMNMSVLHRYAEIGGTWYHPSVWRTRINTECKYLLLQYCFEQIHTIRVQLTADVRNERSNRAIQRLGAVLEGRLRRHRVMEDGYIRDSNVYSIVDEEWPQVKERLEQFLNQVYV
ncbi:GNAT family N-acetyltransferase [Paenibacillus alvei]|uniref:GNAT family N-acetyltransferase n=1 Tax=Paenibacillus alvei TaxID=44250 RepID=A0ABT4GY76_PAEAL|nr:GNAT family protein [Paenibacillus alvei]EJW16216.1 acetyltransferase, GNAT family [Paenibacillus alvei DSM 29]MCY7483021.1 GNAT family N-acetyltransferase [Paenibacillus alvei]MCY9544951.1 GNAT family N-acetyltransferase [Paenibacillus alvei]MCY9704451.1 GNAT family N-acetyltransferase [Paenibacillus alvei]MCY9732888.1 GNAT family N-acetyltransferase [Paenibacillus alvei]